MFVVGLPVCECVSVGLPFVWHVCACLVCASVGRSVCLVCASVYVCGRSRIFVYACVSVGLPDVSVSVVMPFVWHLCACWSVCLVWHL